jgi:hypothetical protein
MKGRKEIRLPKRMLRAGSEDNTSRLSMADEPRLLRKVLVEASRFRGTVSCPRRDVHIHQDTESSMADDMASSFSSHQVI